MVGFVPIVAFVKVVMWWQAILEAMERCYTTTVYLHALTVMAARSLPSITAGSTFGAR